MKNGNNDSRSEDQPSLTNPQCKVCMSPDRFEIEVALAQGQRQEAVARRFSRNGQAFSRQNVNSHYHRHMQVIHELSSKRQPNEETGCSMSAPRSRSRNRTSETAR